jgi:arylsulfatase A-like enzyme
MINFTPTILNILNIDIPNSFKGKPINFINNDNNEIVISEYIEDSFCSYSCRLKNWKYIYTIRDNSYEEELYNLHEDKNELFNLTDKKELKDILLKLLNKHIKRRMDGFIK